MHPRESFGLKVFVLAAAVGVAGNALLRDSAWHLGFAIWTAMLVGIGAYLWLESPMPVAAGCRSIVPLGMGFAICCAWRDSSWLLALNIAATASSAALFFARCRTWRGETGAVGETIRGWIGAYFVVWSDFWALVFSDIKWSRIVRPEGRERLATVLRGVGLAIPILLIFGVLLGSADAVFESFATSAFDWGPFDVASSASWTLGAMWIAGSLYRRTFLAADSVSDPAFWTRALAVPAPPPVLMVPASSSGPSFQATLPKAEIAAPKPPRRPFALGITEMVIVLGSLNAMFLAFLLIQVRYLFGGASVVLATGGMSFAEYARRGFFELVFVFALALPLLLWLTARFRNGKPTHHFGFQLLVGTSCGLLFAMMGSAVFRLLLYVDAYGLTELRFYSTGFLVWLAVCTGLFLATALRGRIEKFAPGAAAGLALVLFGLNAINPDAVIANTNLGRSSRGGSLDIDYLFSLSEDAIPTIARGASALPETVRAELADRIHARYRHDRPDWKSWNLGVAWARDSVRSE